MHFHCSRRSLPLLLQYSAFSGKEEQGRAGSALGWHFADLWGRGSEGSSAVDSLAAAEAFLVTADGGRGRASALAFGQVLVLKLKKHSGDSQPRGHGRAAFLGDEDMLQRKHDQAPGALRRFWSEAQCEAGHARYRAQGASCL